MSSRFTAHAAAMAQAQKIKRRPGQLATLTPPARDEVRHHVLICGASAVPDVFLVPIADEPLRQEGSQWADANIAADTAVMQAAVHAITITSRDLKHAGRAPVDQSELRVSPDMDVVVLCPFGPDWPRQWQSVEISNGRIGEPYRPPANFAIDVMVRAAVMNRGRYQCETWVRPDWKFGWPR